MFEDAKRPPSSHLDGLLVAAACRPKPQHHHHPSSWCKSLTSTRKRAQSYGGKNAVKYQFSMLLLFVCLPSLAWPALLNRPNRVRHLPRRPVQRVNSMHKKCCPHFRRICCCCCCVHGEKFQARVVANKMRWDVRVRQHQDDVVQFLPDVETKERTNGTVLQQNRPRCAALTPSCLSLVLYPLVWTVHTYCTCAVSLILHQLQLLLQHQKQTNKRRRRFMRFKSAALGQC